MWIIKSQNGGAVINSARYSRFNEVLQYAAQQHAGQVRKGTDIPYIVHPVAVAETLARHHLAAEVVYAGLLHDVLEDTGVTGSELTEQFGPRVATLVQAVSEVKNDNDGGERPWAVRKAEQIAHLQTAELDVVCLKAADVLHNLASIRRDLLTVGDSVWERFKVGKADQVAYYTKLVQMLVKALDEHALGRELQIALAELLIACS